MPWVSRPTASRTHRLKRRAQRLAYDHSNAVTGAGIGGACIFATLVGLRIAGII